MRKKYLLLVESIRHKFYSKFGRTMVVNQTVENAQQVLIIEPDACCENLKLGISDERAEQLHNGVVKLFGTEKDIIGVVQKMGPECKHANELFFVSMAIMQLQEESRMTKSEARRLILRELYKNINL